MNSMKPFGSYPTPYGVEVPVYRPENIDPDDPEACHFSMDATAICAGIYDQAARARFVADAKRLGRVPAFEPYGGGSLLHVPVKRPANEAAYRKIVDAPVTTPIEDWITGALDRFRWCDRAEFLVSIIGENMEVTGPEGHQFDGVYAFGLAILLTGTLEHLGETEIDCIEAAALYALAGHDEYASAGRKWLFPVRNTWFRDWASARPRYQRFVRALKGPMQLPGWLAERGLPTGQGGTA